MKANPMTDEEREALRTAISLYVEQGILLRACQSTEAFLARVPCKITTRRLSTLIKCHGKEIGEMAGAKNVRYESGSYSVSSRGAFGRSKGGDRAKRIKPSLTFLY